MVDNSSAFRMDPNVPLVIPEINAGRIRDHKGIIANPNCSAITALVPLWPIHQQNRIKRVILSTYQAASGAGAAAMEELVESTRAYLDGRPFTPKVIPHPYAFNLFSHNTASIPRPATTTRRPRSSRRRARSSRTRRSRSASPACACRCCAPIARRSPSNAKSRSRKPRCARILADAPGVKIVDDRAKNYFPMPIDASGQDDVLVGRIRKDLSDPIGHSISMFVAADQLLKGAALNAIQIAELVAAARDGVSRECVNRSCGEAGRHPP